ncbi:VOC family protein [Agromyces endophyticus]|uniref:VOC family protein n=1 Tax=Agromyces sp. H17E-10 TaxID=2932244 RepID=UPI001FD33018|nr:VOC family protein [Agromyces sp. H17E-10]UOQ89392.1 VOC family protein [Agromyces sp. H17E-10]
METTLHRVIVSVESAEAALAFYRDLLGLTVHAGGGITRLSDGAVEILLHERPSRPSDLGIALSFRVDDLDATCATWRRAGGTVVDPPAEQPWGEHLAVLRDADGHLVCLTQ